MSHEGAGAQSGTAANVTAPEIGSSALFGGVVSDLKEFLYVKLAMG